MLGQWIPTALSRILRIETGNAREHLSTRSPILYRTRSATERDGRQIMQGLQDPDNLMCQATDTYTRRVRVRSCMSMSCGWGLRLFCLCVRAEACLVRD